MVPFRIPLPVRDALVVGLAVALVYAVIFGALAVRQAEPAAGSMLLQAGIQMAGYGLLAGLASWLIRRRRARPSSRGR